MLAMCPYVAVVAPMDLSEASLHGPILVVPLYLGCFVIDLKYFSCLGEIRDVLRDEVHVNLNLFRVASRIPRLIGTRSLRAIDIDFVTNLESVELVNASHDFEAVTRKLYCVCAAETGQRDVQHELDVLESAKTIEPVPSKGDIRL